MVKDSLHIELVEEMSSFFEDNKPKVGIFWYNYRDNILFGVMKDDAEKYEKDNGWGTLPKLHKTYWQKQHHRAVAKGRTDSVFYQEHNYTQIPRGRVFVSKGKFFVAVGDWINGYIDNVRCVDKEKLHELLEDEFNLPADFEFYEDIHWNIGHGWSEEIGSAQKSETDKKSDKNDKNTSN